VKEIDIPNSSRKAVVDDEDFDRLIGFAWKLETNGYARAYVKLGFRKYGAVYMHRMVMLASPGQIVDHRDGCRINNQKSNLRFCDASQNVSHATKLRRHNTTGKTGVTFHKTKKRWMACIWAYGKRHQRSFRTFTEAVHYRKLAEVTRHGDFRPVL
jgi:hypothetical protein